MKLNLKMIALIIGSSVVLSCNTHHNKKSKMKNQASEQMTAAEILENPDYVAISYGGYREKSRSTQPTIIQLKEDLKILHAMGIRILRTYNVQTELPHASNLLEAISQLKKEDPSFEMYVMLGAWMDCLNAWTEKEPNHDIESAQNEEEIKRAVFLANKYPSIVKVIAVGNEAMVRWATSYYVQPKVILKYVNHLQNLKKNGELSKDVWITSSDDFSSWGGGDLSYRVEDLEALIKSVDYVSMHTYAYHNSHYNPGFWKVPDNELHLNDKQKIDRSIERALEFSKKQYKDVSEYVKNWLSQNDNSDIYIGCDSQETNHRVTYVTTICLYEKGRGAHVIYKKEYEPKTTRGKMNMHTRLWTEVTKSIEVADMLKVLDRPITVHVDYNSKQSEKSN